VIVMCRCRVPVVAFSLLASAVAAGCSSSEPSRPDAQAPPLAVTTAVVSARDGGGTSEAGGIVQAQTTAVVTARILAAVREVRVAPGDRVRAGDVLVVLDASDLAASARSARAAQSASSLGVAATKADVRSAEAALTLAKATYDRVAALAAKKSATAHELDEATAALRGAEARAAGAQARVAQAESDIERARGASEAAGVLESYTRLTAPFDGVVTAKMVEVGNMASPGMPLVRVEDTRRFRIDVRVDESRVGALESGTAVRVSIDASPAGSLDFEGRVVEVSRAVDADTRAVLVKVSLPESAQVRSGMFGRVALPGTGVRALNVPAAALVHRGQVTSAFVVEEGIARLRLVSVRGTEVLAGLTDGEVVIVNPPPGLVDGRRVTTGGR
jgi:RND family efflux transporter MFP subunit